MNYEKNSDTEIVQMNIDELELSVRSFNALKRVGINTVEELLDYSDDEMMGARNLGRKDFKEALDKAKALVRESALNADNEYTEDNHPGRDKCNKLREI